MYPMEMFKMVDALVTFSYLDGNGGTTTRSFRGTGFTDANDAVTAADALRVIMDALTLAHIFQQSVCIVDGIDGVAGADTSVFEVAQTQFRLVGNKNYTFLFPAPRPTLFSGNTVLISDLDDFIGQFESGDPWTVSDGDKIASTIGGKRAFVNSGKTNLK